MTSAMTCPRRGPERTASLSCLSTCGPASDFSPPVLLLADLLHPLNRLAVNPLLDGDVRHGGGRRGPVPVLLARREPHHIPGPDLLARTAPALGPAAAGGDDERLAQRVRVPRRAGAGLECDAGADRAPRPRRFEQRINPHRTREVLRRSPPRRTRTHPPYFHDRPFQSDRAQRHRPFRSFQ